MQTTSTINLYLDTYLELPQTSKMELFVTLLQCHKQNSSNLDVCGSASQAFVL